MQDSQSAISWVNLVAAVLLAPLVVYFFSPYATGFFGVDTHIATWSIVTISSLIGFSQGFSIHEGRQALELKLKGQKAHWARALGFWGGIGIVNDQHIPANPKWGIYASFIGMLLPLSILPLSSLDAAILTTYIVIASLTTDLIFGTSILDWKQIVKDFYSKLVATLRGMTTHSSFAVHFSAMTNPGNKNTGTFPVKDNSIVSNLKAIGGNRTANYAFGKSKRIGLAKIMLNFSNYSTLEVFGQFKEHPFGVAGKIVTNHLIPAFFLTSFPETRPDLRDSSNKARNSGLEADISSSISSSVSSSRNKPSVLPLSLTRRTMPRNKKGILAALDGVISTIFSSDIPFNRDDVIFSPLYKHTMVHILSQLVATSLLGLSKSDEQDESPTIIALMPQKRLDSIKEKLNNMAPEIAKALPELNHATYADLISYAAIKLDENKQPILLIEDLLRSEPKQEFLDSASSPQVEAWLTLQAILLAHEGLQYKLRKQETDSADLTEEMAMLFEVDRLLWLKLKDKPELQNAIIELAEELDKQEEQPNRLAPSIKRLAKYSTEPDNETTWETIAKELAKYPRFAGQTFEKDRFLTLRQQLNQFIPATTQEMAELRQRMNAQNLHEQILKAIAMGDETTTTNLLRELEQKKLFGEQITDIAQVKEGDWAAHIYPYIGVHHVFQVISKEGEVPQIKYFIHATSFFKENVIPLETVPIGYIYTLATAEEFEAVKQRISQDKTGSGERQESTQTIEPNTTPQPTNPPEQSQPTSQFTQTAMDELMQETIEILKRARFQATTWSILNIQEKKIATKYHIYVTISYTDAKPNDKEEIVVDDPIQLLSTVRDLDMYGSDLRPDNKQFINKKITELQQRMMEILKIEEAIKFLELSEWKFEYPDPDDLFSPVDDVKVKIIYQGKNKYRIAYKGYTFLGYAGTTEISGILKIQATSGAELLSEFVNKGISVSFGPSDSGYTNLTTKFYLTPEQENSIRAKSDALRNLKEPQSAVSWINLVAAAIIAPAATYLLAPYLAGFLNSDSSTISWWLTLIVSPAIGIVQGFLKHEGGHALEFWLKGQKAHWAWAPGLWGGIGIASKGDQAQSYGKGVIASATKQSQVSSNSKIASPPKADRNDIQFASPLSGVYANFIGMLIPLVFLPLGFLAAPTLIVSIVVASLTADLIFGLSVKDWISLWSMSAQENEKDKTINSEPATVISIGIAAGIGFFAGALIFSPLGGLFSAILAGSIPMVLVPHKLRHTEELDSRLGLPPSVLIGGHSGMTNRKYYGNDDRGTNSGSWVSNLIPLETNLTRTFDPNFYKQLLSPSERQRRKDLLAVKQWAEFIQALELEEDTTNKLVGSGISQNNFSRIIHYLSAQELVATIKDDEIFAKGTKSLVITPLDVSDMDDSAQSRNTIRFLVNRMLKAKENGVEIFVPLITNQDSLDKDSIQDRVLNTLIATGTNVKEANNMMGRAHFGEFMITRHDLAQKQKTDPAILIDSEAAYFLIQERIKTNMPALKDLVPVYVLTANPFRWTKSWRKEIAMHILTIISPTDVIEIERQTESIFERIRITLKQA